MSGLLIILASCILYINQVDKIEGSSNAIEIEILKSESTFFKDSLLSEIELDRLTSLTSIDSIEISLLRNLGIKKKDIGDKEVTRIREQLNSTSVAAVEGKKILVERWAASKLHDALTAHLLNLQKAETKKLIYFSIISLCGLIIGLFLSFYGYNNWVRKVQNLIDQKLRNEVENS
ncbi:hypothetical protein [Sediminibacterium ginsengisoli]|nr:hypothetical protein [Sediminibacterium ginsengisoli]